MNAGWQSRLKGLLMPEREKDMGLLQPCSGFRVLCYMVLNS